MSNARLRFHLAFTTAFLFLRVRGVGQCDRLDSGIVAHRMQVLGSSSASRFATPLTNTDVYVRLFLAHLASDMAPFGLRATTSLIYHSYAPALSRLVEAISQALDDPARTL